MLGDVREYRGLVSEQGTAQVTLGGRNLAE
jgi:hypothetical protein